MAKKKTESLSLGLSLPVAVREQIAPPIAVAAEPADLDQVAEAVEAFDDYEEVEAPDVARVVTVSVEPFGDQFETSKVGHFGTCWARMIWTRQELEDLVVAARAALGKT